MKKALTLFFVASLAFSCAYETITPEDEVNGEKTGHSIPGSWLYVEYGYSPGDKYHTVPVPADPPGTLTFKSDLTMSSKNMGLDQYKYYRLLQDTVADRQVIAFFEEDPGQASPSLAGLSPTYNIVWQENHLVLHYRWCIEGCHIKFKRNPLTFQ